MAKKNQEHCSFCGRPSNQVMMLITGIDGYIFVEDQVIKL